MRLLLVIAALTGLASAQTDCSQGACYPPPGDLLLGRGQMLHASSTCGLSGSEIFCTPFHQWRLKCCPCDSRNPSSSLAHTVQDVLSTAGADRWWQSKKDLTPVYIQLDLPSLFQLDNLILKFKGPRPNALVIERTLDDGTTWHPALYIASDCQASFPGVSKATPRTMDQTYCYTLPPVGPNQYRDQIIQFSPLRQYAFVPAPEGHKIELISGLTGLRVRLTELGGVPRLPGRALSRYYALSEMNVMGSCMCHGHANRCLADRSSNSVLNSVLVSDTCDCQHNTVGVNCERCADMYNDLPWRPAEKGNTHTCKRCECNNHAQRCRFDQAVYEASGRQSGGVCESCMHHTTGPKCDQCAPGYQPNPWSTMDQSDACIRCACSPEGAMNGGQCDDSMGSCRCKANVEGPHCDRCRSSYYGMSASNPLGCTQCSCSQDGSSSSECDPLTGQCPCRAHFHGLNCDLCSKGYWKPARASRCKSCGCDPTNSLGDACDQLTGQCKCRPGFGGHTCTECPDNTYGDPLLGCRSCDCSAEGICDRKTGACLCRLGIAGPRCDTCSRGHCDKFPTCEICPLCFFHLDGQIRNLSVSLESLPHRRPSFPPGTGEPTSLGPRIQALEARLNQIQNSVPLIPSSVGQINKAVSQLNQLRKQMEQLDGDFSPLEQVPGQGLQLEAIQATLEGLLFEYNAKKSALKNSINADNEGDLSAIEDAFDESTAAAKSVEASGKTVDQSAAAREDTLDLQKQVQPANTQDLEKLDTLLDSRPDLTPTAKRVCGSTRAVPCTPKHCEDSEEDLCPVEGVPPCGRGQNCVGALPLGKRAMLDAGEVKDRVGSLKNKIEQAEEQFEEAKNKANQVRKSSENLSNQIKQTRDDLEADLKDSRNVIKELRDFLSAPNSNLTHVKEVCDWILNAKIRLSLAALKRKLEDLKNLAAGLPDSADVLKQAEPQLDTARRLLQEAKDARDAVLGVKADVDGLLNGLESVEHSISGLEDKLQESMDTIDDLNDNLDKSTSQLNPAEKTLRELMNITGEIKPQLANLKDLLFSGGELARNATEEATKAETEADAAAKDLKSLEKQLALLRTTKANSGRGDGATSAGERLQKLQQEAGSLAKDTGDILMSLAGKVDSLRRIEGEVLRKSQKLNGLDAKLQDLLAQLRTKAQVHATCLG